MSSSIGEQVRDPDGFKYVAATYNKEYLPIDDFINIKDYIERNKGVHFKDLEGLMMLVVRKPNNNKQ